MLTGMVANVGGLKVTIYATVGGAIVRGAWFDEETETPETAEFVVTPNGLEWVQ